MTPAARTQRRPRTTSGSTISALGGHHTLFVFGIVVVLLAIFAIAPIKTVR